MKIDYRKWEPNMGLEEIQAKIYTEVSGLPARADQIGPRNDQRGADATRYALTDDGAPLAYVTSYMDPSDSSRAGIGYPWAMPDCPKEAQDKIFNDLFSHLKEKDEINEIRTGIVVNSKVKSEMIEYFKAKGFVEYERAFQYNVDLDVKETAALKLTEDVAGFTSKVATESDIDTLVEVSLADQYLKNAFPSEEAFRDYFKDRVLKDGHAIIIFEDDKAIAASAPLRFQPDGAFLTGDEERIIMRFTAVRTGYEHAWHKLVVELAKECKSAGWTDLSIRVGIGFTAQGAAAVGLSRIQPEIEEYQIGYTFRK
ncbi:MAG: hypothetical protein ACW98Y_06955 [Candidatus Thorarchaeota archaeon]|jgi:hypothetical protein